MSMFIDEVKRNVPIGSQNDEKLIARELRKESYRKLKSVHFDGRNIVLIFGEYNFLKQKNRVVQLSRKKHKSKEDLFEILKKENPNNTWKLLENGIIDFPDKWLVFLTS